MSTITLLHEITSKMIVNGKVVVHEEYIIVGDKGLKIKYYHKEDDKKEKVTIFKNGEDEYKVITVKGDTEKDEQTLTEAKFLELLAKDKKLKFALEYVKDIKKATGSKPRSQSRTSKRSKKATKKSSKSSKTAKKSKRSKRHH